MYGIIYAGDGVAAWSRWTTVCTCGEGDGNGTTSRTLRQLRRQFDVLGMLLSMATSRT
jgi:hypothetical protein